MGRTGIKSREQNSGNPGSQSTKKSGESNSEPAMSTASTSSSGSALNSLSSGAVDPEILNAIQVAIKPMLDAQSDIIKASQQAMSKKLDDALMQITTVSQKVNDLEVAVQHSSDRVDNVVKETLPTLSQHVSAIATALAMRQLDLDVHQRKWALVIDGVNGRAGEDERRAACLTLGRDDLGIPNAMETRVSACHRLSQEDNAAIYIRFTDLSERDTWLSSAKNLAGKNSQVSISPDMPPILRPVKKDLLLQRKELPVDDRKKSGIHYMKQWPYMKLRIRGKSDRLPKLSKESIVAQMLGFDSVMEIEDK